MTKKKEIESCLRHIQSKFSRFYAQLLTEKNISLSHFSLLLIVLDEGPLRMNALAQKVSLSASAITYAVDQLEKAALVRRTLDADDRRALLIEITGQGQDLVNDIRKSTVVQMAGSFDEMSEPELDSVIKFYKLMEKTLDQLLQQGNENRHEAK